MIIATATATTSACHDTYKCNEISARPLPANICVTVKSVTQIAKTPHRIPNGIAITPSTTPSNNTFFRICFEVAPMLANIPYCLIRSIIEMSKLFLMTKTDVNIIIRMTITAIRYNTCMVCSDLVPPSNCSSISLVMICSCENPCSSFKFSANVYASFGSFNDNAISIGCPAVSWSSFVTSVEPIIPSF